MTPSISKRQKTTKNHIQSIGEYMQNDINNMIVGQPRAKASLRSSMVMNVVPPKKINFQKSGRHNMSNALQQPIPSSHKITSSRPINNRSDQNPPVFSREQGFNFSSENALNDSFTSTGTVKHQKPSGPMLKTAFQPRLDSRHATPSAKKPMNQDIIFSKISKGPNMNQGGYQSGNYSDNQSRGSMSLRYNPKESLVLKNRDPQVTKPSQNPTQNHIVFSKNTKNKSYSRTQTFTPNTTNKKSNQRRLNLNYKDPLNFVPNFSENSNRGHQQQQQQQEQQQNQGSGYNRSSTYQRTTTNTNGRNNYY